MQEPRGRGGGLRDRVTIRHGRGRPGAGSEGQGHDRLEPRASFRQGQATYVDAVDFEQVVGDEHAGHLLEQLLGHASAAAPLRDCGKSEERAVAHGQQFAVEHRAGGDHSGGRDDLRKGLVGEFLAAAPERGIDAAAHELRPHPVPLPFHDPVGDGSQFARLALDRRC